MPLLLKKAGELGLLGGGIPEEYGGSGLDKISATVLAEKLAGYASFAVSHGAHCGHRHGAHRLFRHRRAEEKISAKIATGELLSCYCLSEPQAGSDALASRTRAVLSPDGKNWLLNGQKMWITNGGFADVYMVFAKVDGEKFSCFIVERGTPGFSAGRGRKKDGHPRQLDGAAVFRKCAGAERKPAARNWSRPHRRVQHAECRAIFAGRLLPGRSEKCSAGRVEIFKGANRVRQAHL